MRAALRRHGLTIGLVALAAVSGVVVYLDTGSVTTTEANQRKPNLFPAWRRAELTALSVSEGPRTTRLTRATGEDGPGLWQIEIGGESYAADEQAVDDYLAGLEFAEPVRTIAEGSVDRAAFGLATPRLTVHVEMGQNTYDLRVGTEAPTPADSVYAEVPGRGVYAITRQLASALAVDPSSLRSRSFVPYFSTDLAKVHLAGAGGERHLERAPWGAASDGDFRFEAGGANAGMRVDRAAMERIFATLGRMQAETFLADADADRALDKAVTLRLVPTSGPDAILDLGGACPGHEGQVVAIRRAPTRASVCVDAAALEALSTPAASLVDAHLVGTAPGSLEEIIVDDAGRKLDLARKSGGFRLRAPATRDLEEDATTALVSRMLAVEATGFVARPASFKPRATLRVVSRGREDGERSELLEIGADEGGTTLVRRAEDGAFARVPTAAVADLLPTDLDLRKHTLLDRPAAEFTEARVSGSGLTQAVRRTGEETFALVEPSQPGLVVDGELVDEALTELGRLHVERWVAERDDGHYGLEEPRRVIEAKLAPSVDESAPTSLRLELGAPATGGSFARMGGDPAVFIVSSALERAASRLWLDRSALLVDPAALARVTFTPSSGPPVTLIHKGDAWSIAGATGPDADVRAAALRDALGDLRADGAVSVGPALPAQGLASPALRVLLELRQGEPVRLSFGAGGSFLGASVVYARRDGVDATFALARSRLQPILDAL